MSKGFSVSSLKVVHRFVGETPANEALNQIATYVVNERPDILRKDVTVCENGDRTPDVRYRPVRPRVNLKKGTSRIA